MNKTIGQLTVDISKIDLKTEDIWKYVYNYQYLHSLEGPILTWIEHKRPTYYIKNEWIPNEEFYNHPEVKRHMLLKALKELK
jgi:hypothetical protein